ncbi:ACT domain-containing protein [Nisaea acidiphila]|uniref:ACT domain-containing protein n=1 Tax=Nisaea acidiphila TaxID=1862145 RepID=A0A9J7AUK3_9PROT|nr:ACT domain-containing protein [Nisaea acidiphila]UUX51411.1 ACT domain-containing protein [Nisaea acidiphila]
MAGETDLDTLIAAMSPRLAEGVFVFATVSGQSVPAGVSPRMTFREEEGLTLVLLKDEAEAAGLEYAFPCRMITLEVHSALEAVGFLARVTSALAELGMGVNPVSGFFHDHLFVPDGREMDALDRLRTLSAVPSGLGEG